MSCLVSDATCSLGLDPATTLFDWLHITCDSLSTLKKLNLHNNCMLSNKFKQVAV